MNTFLLFIPIGLGAGSVYALVALGIVIVYRASGVLNFTAGATGVVGVYVYFNLRNSWGWSFLAAFAVGIAAGALIGALTEVLVMRRLRHASAVVRLIATLGVLTILTGFANIFWGTEQPSVNPILPQSVIHLSPTLAVGWDRVTLFGIAVVVAVALKLVYSKTRFGMATTAVAENREAASALGWSSGTIELVNWVIGGALSAFAAIMISPIVGVSIEGLVLLVVPALAAALIGGFNSFLLTTLGAMIIGIGQAEAARFVTIPGFSDSVPFLLIVLIVVLGGRARPSRQDLPVRLPLPGSGRVSVRWILIGAVIAELFAVTAPVTYVSALSATLAVALLVLSVVVLTGYAGQVSLGQWALAGFAAWVAGRLVASAHLTFGLAFLCAIAASIPAGVLIALPALRTRGVNLAIVTLGLALAIEDMLLQNGNLTGGVEGTNVGIPHFLWFNLDPINHPTAYATFSLIVFILAALLVANIRRGRTGRRLIAVRSDETVASSLGIGVYGAKIYAFGVGAFLAALAGVLTAFQTPIVVFSQFDVFGSIYALVYAVIGGIGWISGSLLGSSTAPNSIPSVFTQQILSTGGDTVIEWFAALAGVLTVVTLIKAPDGLAKLIALSVRDTRSKVVNRLNLRGAGAPASSISENGASPPSERSVIVSSNTPDPRSTMKIEVRDAAVRFGGVRALNGVSFDISQGEVLGLIGPNGAGKTTLLDALSGFTKLSDGSLRLNGRAIMKWSPVRRARAGIGRSFQGVALFNEMSVMDNLLTAADEHRVRDYFADLVMPGRSVQMSEVERMIEKFDLGSVLQAKPAELPQGTARRVGVARAMVARPSILFLDEPAAGLDPADRTDLGRVIRLIAQSEGIGVVLVEHDVPLVLEVCDRIVVLDFGVKIAEGTPEEIRNDAVVRAAYLGEDHVLPPRQGAVLSGQAERE
jgi:ABC-type branched-subunit amino acid transport system ATPase component/branched-subunit amino acid ABC-type transport system permease component